jgi:hypothetical protein
VALPPVLVGVDVAVGLTSEVGAASLATLPSAELAGVGVVGVLVVGGGGGVASVLAPEVGVVAVAVSLGSVLLDAGGFADIAPGRVLTGAIMLGRPTASRATPLTASSTAQRHCVRRVDAAPIDRREYS